MVTVHSYLVPVTVDAHKRNKLRLALAILGILLRKTPRGTLPVYSNNTTYISLDTFHKVVQNIDNKLHGVTASRDDEFTWMTLTQNMLPWDFAKIYVELY